MITLGLTGSIAMGKSTAAAMLQQMRIPVHDSDAAVHYAYNHDKNFQRQIYEHFPECYDRKTKSIDRKKLAEIIYSDAWQKQLLENLLHPRVWQSQKNFLRKCARLKQDIAVLDIPLLYETNADLKCDAVMVVTATYHIQKMRVMARPGMTEEKFHKILNSQMSDAEKRGRADWVIHSGLGRKKMFQDIQSVLREISAAY